MSSAKTGAAGFRLVTRKHGNTERHLEAIEIELLVRVLLGLCEAFYLIRTLTQNYQWLIVSHRTDSKCLIGRLQAGVDE
jgi:hypothetical protein